jgi:hypothetical protein
LPGLVQECSQMMQKLKLPNILEHKITKPQWKALAKKTIPAEKEKELKRKSYNLTNGNMQKWRRENLREMNLEKPNLLVMPGICSSKSHA